MAIGTPYTVVAAEEIVSTATTTYQVTVTHNTVAGDAIAAAVVNSNTAVSGVTDSQGNVYVLARSDTGSSLKTYIFTAVHGSGGSGTATAPLVSGTDWIKATFGSTGATTTEIAIIARGCSGISSIAAADSAGTANADGTSTSPAVTGTTTLACPAEWIVAALAAANGTGVPSAWSDSFVQAATVHGTGEPQFTVADEVVSATTAQAAAATITSGKWALVQVALIAANLAVPLADTGSAADALTAAAAVAAAEAGSASDALMVGAGVAATETGTAADALSVGAAVPLAEGGSAADALTVGAAVPLADAGSAAESLSVTVPIAIADAGSAADALTVVMSVPAAGLGRIHGRNGVVYLGASYGAPASPLAFQSDWSIAFTATRTEITPVGDAGRSYVDSLPEVSGDFTGFYDDATSQTYIAAVDGLPRNFYLYPSSRDTVRYFFGTILPDFAAGTGVQGAGTVKTTWEPASPLMRSSP